MIFNSIKISKYLHMTTIRVIEISRLHKSCFISLGNALFFAFRALQKSYKHLRIFNFLFIQQITK